MKSILLWCLASVVAIKTDTVEQYDGNVACSFGCSFGFSKSRGEHWQRDCDVEECNTSDCKVRFGLMTRKHHCRDCGLIFCHSCSPSSKKDGVRRCSMCEHPPLDIGQEHFGSGEDSEDELWFGTGLPVQKDLKVEEEHSCAIFPPSEIIQPVKWQKDSDASECTTCSITFGPITRRHHCRQCYQIFCNTCSPYRKQHGERRCNTCNDPPSLPNRCERCGDQYSQVKKLGDGYYCCGCRPELITLMYRLCSDSMDDPDRDDGVILKKALQIEAIKNKRLQSQKEEVQ